ncbi:MAG: T9SS type A sorting domain-containing protein, partial [Flavobacteriales bacterium]|nr:T9SS type A sorting domain-containing protein [Flavobacteriales bacterium]
MGKEGSPKGQWDLSSLNASAEEHYLPCDATGFIKDLVAIPFSGHASSGMSWDENNDQSQWFWMGKLRSFLETEFLDEIDLNNDSWIPGVAQIPIELNGFVEAIYLKRTQNDHNKLIGVIFNQSWNWYTINSTSPCTTNPSNELILLGVFENFQSAHFGNNAIYIQDMDDEMYHIQYFDPLTLQLIDEYDVLTFPQGVPLWNFPVLDENRKFILFKCWKNDGGEQFMPLHDSDSKLVQSVQYLHPISDVSATVDGVCSMSNSKIIVNRNIGAFAVDLPLSDPDTVDIFDSAGRIVFSAKICNHDTIYVGDLSPGIYVIRVG